MGHRFVHIAAVTLASTLSAINVADAAPQFFAAWGESAPGGLAPPMGSPWVAATCT